MGDRFQNEFESFGNAYNDISTDTIVNMVMKNTKSDKEDKKESEADFRDDLGKVMHNANMGYTRTIEEVQKAQNALIRVKHSSYYNGLSSETKNKLETIEETLKTEKDTNEKFEEWRKLRREQKEKTKKLFRIYITILIPMIIIFLIIFSQIK